MSEIYYDYVFKIIMLGDSGYGKSSIVFRLLKDEFLKKKEPTIGLDFYTKTLAMTNGKKVKFNMGYCWTRIICIYY